MFCVFDGRIFVVISYSNEAEIKPNTHTESYRINKNGHLC